MVSFEARRPRDSVGVAFFDGTRGSAGTDFDAARDSVDVGAADDDSIDLLIDANILLCLWIYVRVYCF